MTTKLRLILLMLLGLLLAALISRNAALAWMILPLLAYILAGLSSIPGEIRLGAHRMVSHERCTAGTLMTMTLAIENHGRDIPSLRLHEALNPRIHLTSNLDEKYGVLPSGGKAEIRYGFIAPRGKYHWETIRITVSDPFSLFDRQLELPAEAEVIVVPAELLEKTPGLDPDHTLPAPGLYRSDQPGSGVDFFGVREYSSGDPLRSIYWRLSARHPGQLFTKEFEREEIADVGLILDGNAAMNLRSGQEELFDSSVQVAALIARSVIREGNRLSMLVLGDPVLRVFPGAGRQHLARILNQLAAARPGENVALDTMKYLPVKLFPSHALIILISPLSERDLPAITRLLASGYQVQVVSPDPVKFARRPSDHPLAVRAATIERAALLWRIREMGVKVLEWPVRNSGPFTLEKEERKPDAKTPVKRDRGGPHLSERIASSIAFPILVILLVALGVLLGLPQGLMIAAEILALAAWEIVSQRIFAWKGNRLAVSDPLKWMQIRPMLFLLALSLFVSAGGLRFHPVLPFEIAALAVLLFLFSFDRLRRLMAI